MQNTILGHQSPIAGPLGLEPVSALPGGTFSRSFCGNVRLLGRGVQPVVAMMAKRNHHLAWEMVEEALHRVAAQEAKEGDAQLVVMGAILEEVSNGRNGSGRLNKIRQVAPPLAGGAGGAVVILELARALVGG